MTWSVQNRETHRDREEVGGCQGLGAGGCGHAGVAKDKYGVLFSR